MEEEEKKLTEHGKISRREFIKDAGLVVGGAAVTSGMVWAAGCGDDQLQASITTPPASTSTTPPAPVLESVAPGKKATIRLTINGFQYELEVTPEVTLRDCLRQQLGLTSIKEFCYGHGACGSCTVIMDGKPILSCMTLAIECGGKTIQTAEGIAAAKHPIVEAYVSNYAFQCGYCVPGLMVTAKALLDKNPNPTEQNVRDALGGNLCRCGPYPAHIAAVLEAAKVK